MSNFYQWRSHSKDWTNRFFSACPVTQWQEAKLPFRIVIQLGPSTHPCQKILVFFKRSQLARGGWSFIVSVFFCSNQAWQWTIPPFLDVFTHIYRMYSISMYFLLDSKLFWRLDESVMPFFHPINCHRISPFNEKVRIPMPSKILNFFKICPALVLLPRPSTSSHPKCGYLHGVWEIPQKRCCLIKWNHKIFDKDPQLQGIFFGGWQM